MHLLVSSCVLSAYHTSSNVATVAERLKQEGRQDLVQNETTEELEDEDGNVYNRKTYEDLKKQGLI